MARANDTYHEFGPLKGLNVTDNPLSLGLEWATVAFNLVLTPENYVANKRAGSVGLVAPTGTYLLHRHLPSTNPSTPESQAELWAFAKNPGLQIFRKVGAAAFVPVALGGVPLTNVTRTVSFNGKLFMAGQVTGENRLAVWDGTQIRRAGLGVAAAPTVANQGAGAYPAIPRFYRIDSRIIDAFGATQARSDLGAGVSFTPSGAGLAARVTRSALVASTHWVVWGSADNITYYQLAAPIPVATTFFDDTVLPANYNLFNGVQSEPLGTFMPPPAATRIITDGNRLLMSGNGSGLTATSFGQLDPRANRVWYTPVLGTLDQGDDERIVMTLDQRNFIDVGENVVTGIITELAGPMDGHIFVFNKRRVWRFVPTGDLITPYLTYPVSDRYGAIALEFGANVCAVTGETSTGQPAVYFLDGTGVYRVSNQNVESASYDVAKLYLESNNVAPWLLSLPERKQVWLVTQTAAGVPRTLVLQCDQSRPDESLDLRGGWTEWQHAEALTAFTAGCRYNNTPGVATQDGERLVPYVAQPAGPVFVYSYNGLNGLDGSAPFIGRAVFGPFIPTRVQTQFRVGQPQMVITRGTLAAIFSVLGVGDSGIQTRAATVDISAPVGTYQIRTFDGFFMADCTMVEFVIGDLTPVNEVWSVLHFAVPISPQEPR